ncbi:hypothetical protein F030043B2_34210 [Bacteroides fragilis]
MSLKTFIIKNEERAPIITTFAMSLKIFNIMSKLTQEQLSLALSKLNSLGPKPCPYCGSMTGFKFSPEGSDIMALENVKTVLQSGYADTIPVLTGMCKNCGYILQFNLQSLGVKF